MADMGRPISSDGGEASDLIVDRISDLPWDVLDIILGKLPLVDAVRTSVLAKDWRYKWLSLSEFVFDDDEFSESLDYSNDGWAPINSVINNFLLNHSDAIKKFVLKTYCASHYSDVYRWILYLSRVSVELFMLEEFGDVPFLMPSHLFSFKQLKRLLLGSCTLRIPPTFQKFNFLSELYLRNASISDEDLERLIIACPNLERLGLLNIVGLKHLKIHAPKLKRLLIDYVYKHIHIESGDDLAMVTIASTFSEAEKEANPDCLSIIQSLSGLKSLLNLSLSGDLIRLMAADYGLDKYPLKNDSLASLDIDSVRFDSVEVFKTFLALFSSCPNLEYLCFSVESAKGPKLVVGFFKENQGQFSFPKLKSIQMRYEAVMGASLKLLEFVGAHSPNLMEVTIFKDGIVDLSKAWIDYLCSRLKRCCPQAAVMYVPAGPDCYI